MGKKSGTKAAHYWLMNPAYAEMSNKKLLEDFKQKKKHVLADTNVPEYLENLVNRPMDVAQLIPVTGKSFSEALLFCRTWGEHVVYKNCSECQKQFLYTTCSPQV